MQMKINAEDVRVSRNYKGGVDIEIDSILDVTKIEEEARPTRADYVFEDMLQNKIELKRIVEVIGADALLDAIGEEEAAKKFNLVKGE